ncbi:MAG: hypothetical protein PVF87_11420 [Acidimicrobiia bacterium]|jgi:hypothetical protein
MNRLLALVLILATAAAACTTSDSGPTDPDAADTCLAEAPDCEDTVAGDLPATEPERGVSVADATAQPIDGAFELRGFFFVDAAGARMCESLLESFPPQCGGASIPVGDFDVDLSLSSEAGVSWTDQAVYLEGEIIGGVFQPLR